MSTFYVLVTLGRPWAGVLFLSRALSPDRPDRRQLWNAFSGIARESALQDALRAILGGPVYGSLHRDSIASYVNFIPTSSQTNHMRTLCHMYLIPKPHAAKTSRTIWSNFTLLCSFYKNFILNFRALTFALFRAFAEVVGEMGEVLCSSREFSEVLWNSLKLCGSLWSLSKFRRSLQSLKPSKVLERF